MSYKNSNFSQKGPTFKLLAAQNLQDDWLNHAWQNSPSKTVVTQIEDTIFIGFEDNITGNRFGVALPSLDALKLGRSLIGHTQLSISSSGEF